MLIIKLHKMITAITFNILIIIPNLLNNINLDLLFIHHII